MTDFENFEELNELTEQEMDALGVISADDALEGNAETNKAVFDKLPKAIGTLLNSVIEKIKKYASYVELKFNEYLPLTSSGNKEVNIAGDLTLKATGNISIEATEPSSEYHAVNKKYLEKRLPQNVSELTNDEKYITSDDLPKNLSDLENDENFATEAFVEKYIPNYGLLKFSGTDKKGIIEAITIENPEQSSLEIYFYQLKLSGSYINGGNVILSNFNCPQPVLDMDLVNKFYVDSKKLSQFTNDAGFITSASVPKKLSQLTNDKGFVNQEYVDGLVGDIDAALDAILAIQNNYINGVMAANEGGDE